MPKLLLKYKHLIAGLFLLFLIVLINKFPDGYIFAGGDTAQLISASESSARIFFEWEARAGLFHFIFFLLDSIGISDTTQLSFYLGIFLFGSFLSFYLFSKILFKIKDSQATLLALFYALNLFTLFVFTGNWGFSYYLSLYISIPMLIGLLIKFLKTKKIIFSVLFALTLFFSSFGFGNPAFAISFFILVFSLIIGLVIFRHLKPDMELAKSLLLLAILSFSVSALLILPLIPQAKNGIEKINNASALDLENVLRERSVPMKIPIFSKCLRVLMLQR